MLFVIYIFHLLCHILREPFPPALKMVTKRFNPPPPSWLSDVYVQRLLKQMRMMYWQMNQIIRIINKENFLNIFVLEFPYQTLKIASIIHTKAPCIKAARLKELSPVQCAW